MPRIRSIKPEIWVSPQVVALPVHARLLFVGLITRADDEGRGTANTKLWASQVFAGVNGIGATHVARWLRCIKEQGLVTLYDAPGHGPLYALNSWKNHQKIDRPTASRYPPPTENLATDIREDSANPRRPFDESSTSTRRGSDLIGSDGSDRRGSDRTRARGLDESSTNQDPEPFARIRAVYPAFTGRHDWLSAERYCEARVEQDHVSWEQLYEAAERYAAFCAAGGVSGPRYVLTPAKFFSAPDKPWLQSWTQPPGKAEQRLSSNVAAAAEAERRIFGDAK